MILRWSRRHRPREFHAIHPEWRVGQYVTYFLERTDARWTAFAISIEAQTEDGAWILRGDFKTALGESTTWFRSDPHAQAHDIDPVPIREELIRASPAEPPEQLQDEPYMQSSIAWQCISGDRQQLPVCDQ